MQFCVTRVILRDLAALVPQIFHSLHKITHFLTGYINSYFSKFVDIVYYHSAHGNLWHFVYLLCPGRWKPSIVVLF
jgi:hypothetical protein